ncbi:MAG TPA: EpsG family protein [Sphingomonas sp.]|uniref:EpsG family protein n=1 Tax=Sphingomonas sp. TaxID=28214 RepID=UPI002C4A5336|nr:EpsG family protein [Sphingomonas sp.]HMI21129.1 EpsG family protein [Sphingomonas sp.]
MFWYLAFFAVLFALAMIEGDTKSRWPAYAAGAILAFIVGLRYETGFDWVDYETYYQFQRGFGETDIYASITSGMFEPGFVLLNRILRTFDFGFQSLIFICGTFSIFAFVKLASRFSPTVGIVVLWYYGFVFLSGPMSSMRYAFAVSFIYLAFIYENDGRHFRAITMALVAISMHYFSAIFIPIIFWRGRVPTLKFSLITTIVGFFVSSVGGNLLLSITGFVLAVAGEGFVADKMQIYSSFALGEVSPFSLAIVVWHLGFLWLVQRKGRVDDYITKNAFVITWLVLVAHSFLAPFPIFWNRIMLVCFPLQAIVLCRAYYRELSIAQVRTPIFACFAAGSCLALVYTLYNSQSLVFKPYQSLAITWVKGPYGNGRVRYQLVRNETNQVMYDLKVQ